MSSCKVLFSLALKLSLLAIEGRIHNLLKQRKNMKMDIKNMVRDFASLGEAKKRSSVYVKAVSLLCAAIVALVLFFMNMTVRGVTDRILVIEYRRVPQLKSMETDKVIRDPVEGPLQRGGLLCKLFRRIGISRPGAGRVSGGEIRAERHLEQIPERPRLCRRGGQRCHLQVRTRWKSRVFT